jgi:hypothetical protein
MINFRYWRSQIHHNFSFITNLWRKLVRRRSRVILELLWRFWQIVKEVVWSVMKTERHRTVLACMAGVARWWVLSVEDAFHVYMYSQLHWRWFGYVSPSYCTTWASLVLACFSFLLDHMSVACCFTYQFSTAHVSYCSWITCHFFFGPRVIFLLVLVSVSYLTTCHDVVRPRVVFL